MLDQFVLDERFIAQRNTPQYPSGSRGARRGAPGLRPRADDQLDADEPRHQSTARAKRLHEPCGAHGRLQTDLCVRWNSGEPQPERGRARGRRQARRTERAVRLREERRLAQARRHDHVWRQIPEKDITGITGLPSSEDLFDAISWDVKVRVVGDRDPRASRWYPLLLGKMGQTNELLARIVTLPVAPADIAPLRDAAKALLGESLAAAKDEISSSLQISVKGSGVHLSEVDGKNKYALAAMLDKGWSGVDLTLNGSYTVADVANSPGGGQSEDFQLVAGLTGSVMKDAIVRGRSVELSTSFKAQLQIESPGAMERKNTFHWNATVSLPFQDKAKLPISITWSEPSR